VEVCDYRDLEGVQSFDKIVSVGMFEHVGHEMLPEFFKAAWQRLKAGGLFLNSGISAHAMEQESGPSFIDRYVFPDGDLVPISTSLTAAEAAGFEVRDLENLQEHYGLTLRQWVRRLEQRADEARRLTDETTYRIWRLYMAGSAQRFLAGRLNTYHSLLVKGSNEDSLPLTRDGWYCD
jgi:cyclopropane-fatty-acyl-phospholipid synthase